MTVDYTQNSTQLFLWIIHYKANTRELNRITVNGKLGFIFVVYMQMQEWNKAGILERTPKPCYNKKKNLDANNKLPLSVK